MQRTLHNYNVLKTKVEDLHTPGTDSQHTVSAPVPESKEPSRPPVDNFTQPENHISPPQITDPRTRRCLTCAGLSLISRTTERFLPEPTTYTVLKVRCCEQPRPCSSLSKRKCLQARSVLGQGLTYSRSGLRLSA